MDGLQGSLPLPCAPPGRWEQRWRGMLLVLMFAAFTPGAWAQEMLLACAGLENDLARLACYDGVSGRKTLGPTEADQAAALARRARERGGDVAGQADGRLVQGKASAAPAPDTDVLNNVGRGSLLDQRWELARDSKLGPFNLRAYKPVYLLPLFWTSDVNQTPYSPNPNNYVMDFMGLKETEAKFQLSFKTKLAENLFGENGDLWFGYTQTSRWQVYNEGISRPFRETNHEPEALMVFRNGYRIGGWRGRMLALGINHQSNGRSDPHSRSWNRLMFNIGLDREDWALMIRPWVRIAESKDKNDNPDIADYMGRGDVTLTRVLGGHQVSLMARHSMRRGERSHGALQLSWGFPIHDEFRGHLQVFSGYGESMIDYNHRATYIGLGVSLTEWF